MSSLTVGLSRRLVGISEQQWFYGDQNADEPLTHDVVNLDSAIAMLLTNQTGTLSYMAPEIDKEDKKGIYDFRADVYSAGLIIWETLQPIQNNRPIMFQELVQ
ncbi:putative serine/threonine-protein kinase tsuA [Folsomia candida]|uniref:Putative serine/threonine-protein kinase tsuA n=1 Tax=Folsomia candida TaxID=158441 RepID=A0A226CVW2_FOLCA|nr:putative serine/threonine-protein kinase tsuA [Folsomia candida]